MSQQPLRDIAPSAASNYPIPRTGWRGKCAEMSRDAEYQKSFRIFQPQLQDLSAAK
jgi:hypothetical protein